MSVLVKDMQMPIQCVSCPMWRVMSIGDALIDICGAKSIRVDPYRTGRDEKCPLVDVPTPHGRLIDADKGKDDMDYVCDAGGWLEPVTKAVNEYVKRHLDAASTVIEAEE